MQRLSDLSVLSESDPADLKALYGAAVEQLDLLTIDYQTIRDLVKLSGSPDITLHVILLALFSSLAEGSVCLKLEPDSLKKKLAPLTGKKTGMYIQSILGGVKNYTTLIHVHDESSPVLFEDPRESFKPLILDATGSEPYLYFHKYHAAEKAAREALAVNLRRDMKIRIDTAALSSAVSQVLHEKPVCINDAPALLNSGQKLGVLLPAFKNFVLISGGPGTGKTFIVLTLLRVMARLGVPADRVRLAAPTGRAAQKLTDSIQRGIASIAERDACDDSLTSLQGTTLHRLLQYSPSRDDFLHNRYNPVPADLLIIDEASMIDIVLLGKLFEAVDEGACLVMLGDRNQLPSVEAGAVLADLIPGDRASSFSVSMEQSVRNIFPDLDLINPAPGTGSHKDTGRDDSLDDRVVILHESYRSEESIKRIAEGINRQDPSIIDQIPEWNPREAFPEHGVWRVEPGTGGDTGIRGLHRILSSWAVSLYESPCGDGASYRSLIEEISGSSLGAENQAVTAPLRKILARLDEGRILTPVRSGLSGTAGINSHLLDKLGGFLDPSGNSAVFSGAPVIITKNDYGRELFNGDVGLMLRGSGGRYYGAFSRHEGIRLYPMESLPPFEPSFAITVHKSQGSEYGSVLLVLPEMVPERLLTTEILYTGLTRAKRLVLIYAARSVLSKAIRNRTERESRIRLK